jgi:polysaccharide export outer membrane protein
MKQTLLFLAIISVSLASCVTNKKYVYLQENDVNKEGLPKDTIVRDYARDPFIYRVQPNDALYIRFESLTEKEFDFLGEEDGGGGSGNRNYAVNSDLVDPEGNIAFPVVGKVQVKGLTVFEVQQKLQELADQYLESPVVKVRLVNFRFTILGEVNQEGTVTSFNNRVTLLEAIGLAGGLGELADRANVKIIRQVNGKTEVAYVDLLSEDFLKSPFYYINQNDVLVVPALKQRPFRKYFGTNFSLVVSSLSFLLVVISLTNNN